MDKFQGELNSVLQRAMRNYSKAVRHNGSKWTNADRGLKKTVRKITGQKENGKNHN